ncbi:MAG TPA: hypothetical protein VKS78_15260 [Roseiarcus sp.]|nr:hypothetical protein [Roseiarcus sp.]
MKGVGAISGILAFLLLAGCGLEKPEVDQIAQAKIIGLSKQKILICMGRPALRKTMGATEIWAYPGAVEIEGEGFATVGNPRHSACRVNVIMTNGAVSQIAYSGPGGDSLDLGEHCSFAAQSCLWPQ